MRRTLPSLLLAAAVLVGAPPAHAWPPPAPPAAAPGSNAAAGAQCADVAPGTTAPREKVRVLVMDLKGAGPRFATARALGAIVAAEAQKVNGYQLLSADEVRAVVENEANKQLVGCDDTGCLAELAEALDADLLVSGALDQTADGAPLLSLSLMNTRALVTMNRVSLPWRGDESRLPEVAQAAAQLLVLEKRERAPGSVLVLNAPADARIFVDDVDRTADAAAGALTGLDVGVHDVKIVALNRETKDEQVILVAGGAAQVDGEMQPVPLVISTWFWVGAAAAVVAGVGATAAALYFSGKSNVAASASVPAYSLDDVGTLPSAAR